MNRRKALSMLAAGSAAGLTTSIFGQEKEALNQRYGNATRGMAPIKITNVRIIHTYPGGIGLGIVKVETSEPGLYGIGCATGIRRYKAITAAVEEYLAPFCMGKNPDNIEDIWQTANVATYWRNGPILNTALAGLDQALWDIKAKRAGMPAYQLFGGKCRFAVDCYAHAGGRDLQEVEDSVREYMEKGFRHIRVQLGGYGSTHLSKEPDFRQHGFGADSDGVMEIGPYKRAVPEMFEHIRTHIGDEVQLLHDIHEMLPPIDAIEMVKELEQYSPFFIEEPFAPEDIGYFKMLREQTSCPIAMGELFNNPHEWTGLISERLIDFIRIHISQIGGVTPALKVARLGEWFNVRTAWHGPGNTSPVGHAANAHIDLAIWNFGIQEASSSIRESDSAIREVFPGTPTVENGYMFVNEAPGFGIDIDEEAAGKYPLPSEPWYARPSVAPTAPWFDLEET